MYSGSKNYGFSFCNIFWLRVKFCDDNHFAIIAGKSLTWLPKCRLNNSIESWTLQFVGEFTRAIELQQRATNGRVFDDLSLKTTLNQIEFTKLFFPLLYRKHHEVLSKMMKRVRSELRKQDQKEPKSSSSENLSTVSKVH